MKLLISMIIPVIIMINSVGIVHADDPDPVENDTQNPVVAFLAGLTGLETQAILDLQDTGFGLGQIAKAYHFVELNSGGELETVLSEAKEIGWGNLYKNWGYHPSEIKGLGWLFKHNDNVDKPGPPDQANNDKIKDDKDKDTSPPDHANNDKIKDDKDDKDDKDKDKD